MPVQPWRFALRRSVTSNLQAQDQSAMAKSSAERIQDTLAYMKTKLSAADYLEVTTKLRARPQADDSISPNDDLSADMSIGHQNPLRKSARRAKRSLILLASLFIEDNAFKRVEIERIKRLPESGEQDLIREMESWFVIPGVTAADVANVAKANINKMANWHNVNLDPADAVRGVYKKDKPFNCYNACVFWAFQAGAISKRFCTNKLKGKDGNHFFPIFSTCGWDTIVEYASTKPPTLVVDRSRGGEFNVPAGLTVYFETPTKVFGHVACSLGDGTVISQNSVIPAIGMKNLDAKWAGEVDKMTRAETHIISIRYLITLHFHPENSYPKVKVTNGGFWEAFPVHER